MLKPTGLIAGHYETRSLDQTVPILTGLLAMEVVSAQPGGAVLQHPNSAWRLVVHDGGPAAEDKPHNNHYGFRVAGHEEVDAAFAYVTSHKQDYGIRLLARPHETHFAYSIYFREPGGNDLEIEWYDTRAAEQGRAIAARPWADPISEERFPGRGYVPQAMSHGTLQCGDQAASNRFYEEVLGLKIVGGGRISTYIAHPSTPWYVVVLPDRKPGQLNQVNRFVLSAASADHVAEAHKALTAGGKERGVTDLDALSTGGDDACFLLKDLDGNWWEYTSRQAIESVF